MTQGEPPPEWFEQGLEARIPVVYQKSPEGGKGRTSKNEALSGLRKIQRYIGYVMLLSAAAGIYLLATDGSLWILAISHAVGLVIIVLLDVLLGVMNLLGSKRVYLASLAAACLGMALQLGDIATAPQYNMTVVYFASYLFGLAAFDLLLLLQVTVVILGIVGRADVQFLASRRRLAKELNYSRRSFINTIAGFGVLIGLGVALSSVKIPPPTPPAPASSATATGPAGSIANTNSMQVGFPVYFYYPSGYPNILFKRSDGSLAAYSLLCTHVCCEVTYEQSSNIFFCACHGSEFDSNGRLLRGPATTNLPSITLSVDGSGNVFPTGQTGYTPC